MPASKAGTATPCIRANPIRCPEGGLEKGGKTSEEAPSIFTTGIPPGETGRDPPAGAKRQVGDTKVTHVDRSKRFPGDGY